MRVRIALSMAALAAFLMAMAPPGAYAKPRDRNRDHISDHWEKKHGLSLRVNQARRDQDRDGLKNRAEYRAHTDPRDDDSDGDGIEDGDEQAGRVTAFAPATGMLTITLFGGGEITGKVTADTSIECDHGDYTVKALAARDDQESDDEEGEHNDGEHGDDEQGDDDEETDDGSCAPDALQEGAIVQEADLKLSGKGAVFEEIELVQ